MPSGLPVGHLPLLPLLLLLILPPPPVVWARGLLPRLLPAGARVRAVDLNMTGGGGDGLLEHVDALVMVVRLPFDRRLPARFCSGMKLTCAGGVLSLPNALEGQRYHGWERAEEQRREAALAAVRMVSRSADGGMGRGGNRRYSRPTPHACEAAFVLRYDQEEAETHPLAALRSECTVTTRSGLAAAVWNASTASAIMRRAEVIRIIRADSIVDPAKAQAVADARRPLQHPPATESPADLLSAAMESYAKHAAVATSFLETASLAPFAGSPFPPPPCEGEAASSDACSQAKAVVLATASDLWSKVSALPDSNVTSAPSSIDVRPRPCVCVDPALENCLAYPSAQIGRLSSLTFEAADSQSVAVVSDDHRIFATPRGVSDGRLIVIYGAKYRQPAMRRSVWIDDSLIVGGGASAAADGSPTPVSSMIFKPGDRVSLRGFSLDGNRGVFNVVAVQPGERYGKTTGVRLVLGEVPPADASPGIMALTRFEANREGATASGCFGHLAGPATALRAITVYGTHNPGKRADELDDSDAASPLRTMEIRFHETFRASRFEVGELIRLQHFKTPGNNGVFRVASRPGRDMLEVRAVRDCGGTNLRACPSSAEALLAAVKHARDRDMQPRRDVGCPANCFHHGWSEAPHECTCDAGFLGPCCEHRAERVHHACPNNCSHHGICTTDLKHTAYGAVETKSCSCDSTWVGPDCGERSLPCPTRIPGRICSGHGRCEKVSVFFFFPFFSPGVVRGVLSVFSKNIFNSSTI